MARVVPVGPIDPELYAFAKKEAEKAERNPRYVPKNCPADRGQIIYKRIGGAVKAMVFPKTILIGNYHYNVRSPVYIFYELDGALEQIESLSQFDDSGNTETPGYTKGSYLGVADNTQAGIRHYYSSESSFSFINNPGSNYWSQSTSMSGSETHYVEFFKQVLNEDGDSEVKLIGQFTCATGTMNYYTFAAGWLDGWDHIRIKQSAEHSYRPMAAAIKGDDYVFLLHRYSSISNSGPGLVFGSGYIAESTEYDLVVNGETVDTIYSSHYEYSYTYSYGSSSGEPTPAITTGRWIKANRWFSDVPMSIPRVDDAGLCYVTGSLASSYALGHGPEGAYRVIANSLGVFIIITLKTRKRVLWIKPLDIADEEGGEKKDKEKEKSSIEVKYLFHAKDTDETAPDESEPDCEIILISPFGTEETTEETDEDKAYSALERSPHLVTRKDSPDDVILLESTKNIYIDLSDIVRQYAEGEIEKSEIEAWRAKDDGPVKRYLGSRGGNKGKFLPMWLMEAEPRKLLKKALDKADQ